MLKSVIGRGNHYRRETRERAGVTEYECTACGEFFAADRFYKDPRRVDGLKSHCKPCFATSSKHPERLDKERARARSKNKSLEARVRALVNRAVKLDLLKRPETCPSCSSAARRVEAHHADYSKPLDVTWLCSQCHADAHVRERAGAPS